MTIDEAIERLRGNYKTMSMGYVGKDGQRECEAENEAIHMAIKALEKQNPVLTSDAKMYPSENDYIKRSDALRPFVFASDGTKYLLHDCDNFPVQIHLKDVQRTLRKIPAADVVEVVRCKDCKFWGIARGFKETDPPRLNHQPDGTVYAECIHGPVEIGDSMYTHGEFYCACGKRREVNG